MANLTPTQKREVLKKIDDFIAEGLHCTSKHDRVEENVRYAGSDQWRSGDLERQKLREKPSLTINDTFKVVHAIANREMVERMVPKVIGRERADAGAAGLLDETSRWQRQAANSEHYESMAFRSAAIGGYGCMHKFWSPVSNGGDGLIVDEDVPIWEMLWPVKAREMNLSDRRWHVRGRWMDLDVIDEVYSEGSRGVKDFIKRKKASINGSKEHMPDPVAGRQAFGGPAGTWMGLQGGQWFNTATKEACLVEAEWKEAETFYRAAIPVRMLEWAAFTAGSGESWPIADPQSGEVYEVSYEEFLAAPPEQRRLMEYQVQTELEIARYDTKADLTAVMDLYSDIFGIEFPKDQWIDDRREVVKFAIRVDDVVIESGKRPWGFSYYFITGFPIETRDGQNFVGVVDIIKGPQDLKNGLISNLVSMYMTSPKGVVFIEKDAGVNIQEFADKFASTGGVVDVPPGFLSTQKFLRLDPPRFPDFPSGLMAIADNAVQTGVGLSPIDLNAQSDLRRISGNVVQAARTASNVVVAILFDSLRKFRKEYGKCNLLFLSTMYTPDELLRIVGEEKAEDLKNVPEEWGEVIKYDIHIDEQPVSATEQYELLDLLTRTGEFSLMRQRGDIDFEEQLELMPNIPESKKRLLLSGKTKREQLQQMAGQLQQRDTMLGVLINSLQELPGGLEALQQFESMVAAQEAMQTVKQGVQPQMPQEQMAPAQ